MKCNNCNFEFESPRIYYEGRGAGCYEKIGICPRCGVDDLDYDFRSSDEEEENEE